jgi:hypothetical protein
MKGVSLFFPDPAPLLVGKADAVHALLPDLGSLGRCHTLGFPADLFLDLFPVQAIHV